MLAATNAQRAAIITAFLEKRLTGSQCRDEAMHTAVRYVIHKEDVPGVRQLASAFNLSPRQFERKFKQYAGFSPKLFSRITRFQAAMSRYEPAGKKQSSKSLTQIAFECGYYDQAHFIHEFKTFSGYHPKKYFSGKAEGIEYREA